MKSKVHILCFYSVGERSGNIRSTWCLREQFNDSIVTSVGFYGIHANMHSWHWNNGGVHVKQIEKYCVVGFKKLLDDKMIECYFRPLCIKGILNPRSTTGLLTPFLIGPYLEMFT